MDYFNQASDRLYYRKLNESDIADWLAFFEDNDRLHFLGLDLTKEYAVLAEEWIHKQLLRYENEGFGQLAVIEKGSNQLVGLGGLIPRELNEQNQLEVTYSIKKEFWGKGYGTEIACQMKEFGQQHNLSGDFISIIHKDNIASINVARKNGMCILFETQFLGMDVYVFGEL